MRGKGGRDDRLPLPIDVGEALAGYLQRRPPPAARRPPCESRAVFVGMLAPGGPLTRQAVGAIVSAACSRAGIPRAGAHRLRHTAATRMLRAGSSLAEIGQLLRHEQLRTTAIYAKLARAGIGVNLDDFGRGQTSLGYLSTLPIDEVKIDRSFVTDMQETSRTPRSSAR